MLQWYAIPFSVSFQGVLSSMSNARPGPTTSSTTERIASVPFTSNWWSIKFEIYVGHILLYRSSILFCSNTKLKCSIFYCICAWRHMVSAIGRFTSNNKNIFYFRLYSFTIRKPMKFPTFHYVNPTLSSIEDHENVDIKSIG